MLNRAELPMIKIVKFALNQIETVILCHKGGAPLAKKNGHF